MSKYYNYVAAANNLGALRCAFAMLNAHTQFYLLSSALLLSSTDATGRVVNERNSDAMPHHARQIKKEQERKSEQRKHEQRRITWDLADTNCSRSKFLWILWRSKCDFRRRWQCTRYTHIFHTNHNHGRYTLLRSTSDQTEREDGREITRMYVCVRVWLCVHRIFARTVEMSGMTSGQFD